jgi:small basic protein
MECGTSVSTAELLCETCSASQGSTAYQADSPAREEQEVAPQVRMEQLRKKIEATVFTRNRPREAERRGARWGLWAGAVIGSGSGLFLAIRAWQISQYATPDVSVPAWFYAVAVPPSIAYLSRQLGRVVAYVYVALVLPIYTGIFRGAEDFEREHGTKPGLASPAEPAADAGVSDAAGETPFVPPHHPSSDQALNNRTC